MNFKANFQIVELSSGLNEFPASGGTAPMHQIYCVSSGGVTVIAEGGGSATFSLNANEKVDVLTRNVTVNSGTFIGFRAQYN